MPNLEEKPKTDKLEDLGLSMLDQIKKEGKKIKIVCQESLAKDYKIIPQIDNFLCVAENEKQVIEKSLQFIHENQLTICHLKLPEDLDVEKKVKKAKKFAKKLWKYTSENGMFFNVWGGSHADNAFVGMAMNKKDEGRFNFKKDNKESEDSDWRHCDNSKI